MGSLKQGCDHGDFSFAFDNSNFSDRLLRICIFSDTFESTMFPERVKTLHIASSILAARSPFFYKLFANGMRESEQYDVTLWINASEETGLMELLKFMYSNNLTLTNALVVLDVLVAADKYDVASCMRHCSRLLKNLTIMTPEFVLVYLDLPSHIIMAEAFQPLTVIVKQLYAIEYKDITKFEDEILNLSLDDVETIIASDYLHVTSEYCVYLFVLKWARYQYPKLEDRRKIIMTRLAKFIRYPYLTYKELLKFLKCNEFEPSFIVSVVREALDFKKIGIVPKDIAEDESHRFVERKGYKRPSRVQVCYQLTWFITVVGWVSKGFVLMMKRVLGGDQVTLAMQMGLYGLY